MNTIINPTWFARLGEFVYPAKRQQLEIGKMSDQQLIACLEENPDYRLVRLELSYRMAKWRISKLIEIWQPESPIKDIAGEIILQRAIMRKSDVAFFEFCRKYYRNHDLVNDEQQKNLFDEWARRLEKKSERWLIRTAFPSPYMLRDAVIIALLAKETLAEKTITAIIESFSASIEDTTMKWFRTHTFSLPQNIVNYLLECCSNKHRIPPEQAATILAFWLPKAEHAEQVKILHNPLACRAASSAAIDNLNKILGCWTLEELAEICQNEEFTNAYFGLYAEETLRGKMQVLPPTTLHELIINSAWEHLKVLAINELKTRKPLSDRSAELIISNIGSPYQKIARAAICAVQYAKLTQAKPDILNSFINDPYDGIKYACVEAMSIFKKDQEVADILFKIIAAKGKNYHAAIYSIRAIGYIHKLQALCEME